MLFLICQLTLSTFSQLKPGDLHDDANITFGCFGTPIVKSRSGSIYEYRNGDKVVRIQTNEYGEIVSLSQSGLQ